MIELTASNIAAWTIARLRVSSGGLKGAAAVVLSAMTFQSRTTSARATAGSTAIAALSARAARAAQRSRNMAATSALKHRGSCEAAEVRQSDSVGSFFELASAAVRGCHDPAMQKYNQYRPVARASEILADRWTPLIVRELILGSHRFNEIERGLPGISRSLLASRLRHLEDAGVIERQPGARRRSASITCRTPAGISRR